MSSLHFHRKIEYDVLRKTEKAVLIKVKNFHDSETSYYIFKNKYEKYLKPLELWCPKTWFKADYDGEYVWQQGFFKNIIKLIEKRKKYFDDNNPENRKLNDKME
jgi:hypothetical protein